MELQKSGESGLRQKLPTKMLIRDKDDVALSGVMIMKNETKEKRMLKVSPDGHHLIYENGEPFFLLMDAGWWLFHRLDRVKADLYLEDRASKGFTVIQTAVLIEESLKIPNVYGDFPLLDNDPTKPNESYFDHVDYIVDKAGSLGLFIGMHGMSRDKVREERHWGPAIGSRPIFNSENARVFGEFLGKRYRESMMIWIVGYDMSPVGYEETWRAFARGLKAGDEGRHLATFHGLGSVGSSPFFHTEDWLDVNMAYSGHKWGAPSYEGIARDYQLTPLKPTFDGEAKYENHPLIGDGAFGYFQNKDMWDGVTRADAHQIREAAYWAMLAGAAGHTYGCNDVWQFYGEEREPYEHPNTPWQKALHFPGAYQMGLMRRLFESRPWKKLVPDQSIIVVGQGEGEDHIQAARAEDCSFMFVYLTFGNPVTMDMTKISGTEVKAHWFNPREGNWTLIGEYSNTGKREFVPPRSGRIWDWVLVLDDAAMNYPVEDFAPPPVWTR